MKKLKSTTAMLLAMIVILTNILAQAQTVTDKSENTDDQVSVSEEQSIDTPSNSDLEIMVYQYENGERNVVYTGALGGYDGGRWSNINFTGIQFFMLWNLSNSDNNEVLYIAPVEPQDEPQNEVKDEQNTTDNAVLALQTRGIECNVNLMYDGAYSERIMIRNQQLSVPIKISNTSNSDRDIICYFAEYDENGQLLSTVLGESIPIGKKRSIATNITKTFSPEAKTAKIFVWDNEDLQPVTGAITLDENDGDYYADTMEEAQTYDTQYSIKGMINTENDVDYIKIVPEVSGLYTLNCISLTNAVATLYNHRHTVLLSRFKSYQKTLYSNQEYYIKITGDVGEYLLTVQCDAPSAAENFSIYDFDVDTNVYKKSILNMCQELLYSDEENSRKMYREYEKILSKLEEYMASGGKIISLNTLKWPMKKTITLDIDDEAGGRIAADYLLEKNPASYAVFTSETLTHDLRESAFCGRIREKKSSADLSVFHITEQKLKREFILSEINRMLDQVKRPAGIMTVCTEFTGLILTSCEKRGWKYGVDFELVGYDFAPRYGDYIQVPRVVQPFREMGSLAMDKLYHLLLGDEVQSEILKPILQEGGEEV